MKVNSSKKKCEYLLRFKDHTKLLEFVQSIFRRVKCDCNFATLLQTYDKIGPDSLISFNDFFLDGAKNLKPDMRVRNLDKALCKIAFTGSEC